MASHVIVHRFSEPDVNSDVYSATHSLSRYFVPVGRALFAAIFLASVPMHFMASTIEHAAAQGVPYANILVPASGVLAALGGLSVLFGYHIKLGAFMLVLFLIPVTIMMHNFWTISDPMQAMLQRAMFMKNVAILGGALLFMYFGAGPFSLDRKSYT